MSTKESTLRLVLRIDEKNVQNSFRFLDENGLLSLYEYLPEFYDELRNEIQRHLMRSSSNPVMRTNPDGSETIAWDVLLRLYMATSASQQFTFATGHLFRGHTSEVFGHVRRAIEGAGIAYLTRSEPDIGELYRNRDRRQFRRRTQTDKILPLDVALTAELKGMIDWASSQIHNNFDSLVNRWREKFSTDGLYLYEYKLYIHEVGDDSLGYFLHVCLGVLRAAERVALLLAESFDLPKSRWHEAHEQFKNRLNALYVDLKDRLKESV